MNPVLAKDRKRPLVTAEAKENLIMGEDSIQNGEAFDGLVENFEKLVGPIPCACGWERIARWERDYPPIARKRRRAAA